MEVFLLENGLKNLYLQSGLFYVKLDVNVKHKMSVVDSGGIFQN